MNINDEKKYVYEMMRSIIEERRTLTEIYFSLKKRLEALEELEVRGLDELSLKSYVDFYNEKNRSDSLNNVKRELTFVSDRLTKDTMPPESPPTVIPSFEISEQKYRDNNKIVKKKTASSVRKGTQGRSRSEKTNYLYDLILTEMKNRSDTAFTAGEVYDILLAYQKFRDYQIEINEFRSNVFYRIVKRHPELIKKVGTGKYQYIDDSSL